MTVDAPLDGIRVVEFTHMVMGPSIGGGGGLVPVTPPDGRATRLPALPIEIDGLRAGLTHDIPQAGGDSDAILHQIGLSSAKVADLRERAIVG